MNRRAELLLLILIIAVLVWALLQKSCGGAKDGDVVESDTVYVVGKPDTLIIHDTVVVESVLPKPYAVYIAPDTVEICDSIRVYENTTGKVTVLDSVHGKLLYQRITAVQDTIIISRTDTMRITNERIKQRKFGLYAGAMYDNQLRPFIGADLNRTFLIAGYGLQDKSVTVGVGYRLTK
jgi:hypothetical protein